MSPGSEHCAAPRRCVWRSLYGNTGRKKIINVRIYLNRNAGVFFVFFLPAPHVDTMSDCDVGGQSCVSGVNTGVGGGGYWFI